MRAGFAALLLLGVGAHAGDSVLWSTNKAGVSVDIKDWDLIKLLKKVAAVSGWRIYMEAGTTAKITATFSGDTPDEAIKRLLAGVNYTKDATSNGIPRLRVYRTIPTAAVEAMEPSSPDAKDYRIRNELLVRLKRNSTESIDDIAKALGAKIVGRDDKLRLYRLQFVDEASADTARGILSNDGSVGAVDSNYTVERPNPVVNAPVTSIATPPPGTAAGTGEQAPTLNPKAPVNGPVIGLIDTAVQMQSAFSQYSLTPLTVVGQPNEPADQISHGTSMFETLLQGMSDAPSKILPVDVYPSGDSTTTYEVVEGTAAAINSGANIINLSLGGTGDSTLLQSLINEGVQKGILFVAASGNVPGTETTYPAAYPGVLAITASDPKGQLASYADDGSFVRAMEPGTSVVYLNGQAWQVEGTSTATAFATSAIAQIINQQHVSINQAVTEFIQAHPPPRH